ncbi:MAG: hypothetical protein KC776_24545 [Myxococcales bacterium]|nr:hypothetical protein [Myxococcales bacterium]MCB9578215.1 hypothetical protein [Polyangiaceae bacterium]
MSGRFWIAAALLGAMVIIPFSPLANLITPPEPKGSDPATWGVGKTSTVKVTLITADSNLLSCAADKPIDGAHCAYKSETDAWPADPSAPADDNNQNVIQPYRTWPDNKLILIAGLWAEKHMAMRLHREPPTGVQSSTLARFVADCEVKFVGSLDAPKLRWNPGAQWQSEPGAALVARPVNCTISEE